MKKFGTRVTACIKSYPGSRKKKKEEERQGREARAEEERKFRERRQRASEAAEDRSRITVPPSALQRDVGVAPSNRPMVDTVTRHQPRGLHTVNNAPVRPIRRKPLKEALESVNPLLAEDDPVNGIPTIYGAGSRYHEHSRPTTFRGSQQSLGQPTTTGESSESGALQPGVADAEDAPAELPLPRRRRRLPNRDVTRRQGRVFHGNELPEVLRIKYVSPTAVNPLTPRDEEDLHITPRSTNWDSTPSSPPTQQFHSNAPPVPALGEVVNGSIARRRARLSESTQEPEPSASSQTQIDERRVERNSLAEVLALPGYYGNGHLPLPAAIIITPDAGSSEADCGNERRSAAASNPSLPGHYLSVSASTECLTTTTSTTQERDISPASSLLSLPSYLYPGRLPRHLRTPTPSPQPSLLSIPTPRYSHTLSPASSLISLPSYLAPGRLPPSLRSSTLSLLSIATESSGTASLRRNLMRVLYEHALTHQRGGGGSGRDSMQSFSTSSSTREIFEGMVEVLANGGRERGSRVLEDVSEIGEGGEGEGGMGEEGGLESREIVGPVAYGVRATTSRDVLRRRGSRGNLRLESTVVGSHSVADAAQHTPSSAEERTSGSSVDVPRGADRDTVERVEVAEEWRRMVFTPSGQHVNPDIMTTVLAGVIEPGLGDFRIEF